MFCTVSVGWSWSWQCDVVQTWSGSQVFMYRIAALALAVEGDLAAAVEDDVRPVVEDLGRGRHADRHGLGPAVEADDAAVRDRRDDRSTCSWRACRCR